MDSKWDGYVLVVEDDDDLRAALTEFLERRGLRVTAVANGAEAMTALMPDRRRPCVVLLDWNMPVVSGREVLEWMANDAHACGVPVYVVTANPPRLVTPGARVIDKGDFEAIFDVIRNHCRAHSRKDRAAA